ncbi:MAG: hypothetical protein M1825_005740 [Sarcosagium campestre]|nr:MAG: hypothetical protein M1825_005740 [Sarcosagium campestre]
MPSSRPLLSGSPSLDSLSQAGRSMLKSASSRRSMFSPAPRPSSIAMEMSFGQKFMARGPESPKHGISQPAASCRGANVKRWDGHARRATEWDGLRRDAELWFPEGDCLVHLNNRGQSRRGPSFKVPFSAIRDANCLPLLEKYSSQISPESGLSTHSSGQLDDGPLSNPNSAGKYEIFIPAPPTYNREQSFQYHLNTRNFFAWMFGRPIVGTNLGASLVGLLDRMSLFRSESEDNVKDILEYLDEEGYLDLREYPDHALAILFFAERFQLRDTWIDAFVHCTGMNDRLIASSEFGPVSRITKALITRAKLEMDIRTEHAEKSLVTFLDSELSGAYLGLGNGARVHLDRFRSFLHAFYVARFGYWPPSSSQNSNEVFTKSSYRAMYFDFRNLYAYLVDNESTASMADNVKPASGGLCVLQNLAAFDRRHKYASLPHPLPLIPEDSETGPSDRSSRPARSGPLDRFNWKLGKANKSERKMFALNALTAATNCSSDEVMVCPLVREYMRFEKECTLRAEDKVSAADARKVRWIVVYAMLQTLISVTRAPKEVRHTYDVSYSLCVQTAGTPPWKAKPASSNNNNNNSSKPKPVDIIVSAPEALRPDTDFFAYKTSYSRDVSVQHPQPRKVGFCEILVHKYGNGTLVADPLDPSSSESLSSSSSSSSAATAAQQDPRTPESSESRWSRSDSDDAEEGSVVADMDHLSVSGSSSIYGSEITASAAREGTVEDATTYQRACKSTSALPLRSLLCKSAHASTDTLTLNVQMNAEVDRYISS